MKRVKLTSYVFIGMFLVSCASVNKEAAKSLRIKNECLTDCRQLQDLCSQVRLTVWGGLDSRDRCSEAYGQCVTEKCSYSEYFYLEKI